ncbi:MAG: sporulation protein YtfJ [Dehalococcoidia bacterium]|nr:MAG: sporulation protein YtfJ [Dehalococcoidia bacterium]
MAEVESVVRTTLEEIEKVLSTKTVVGEPMTIEGNTLILLISIGFGFGAGAGTGKGEKQKGEGTGAGTGGGAGVKPVAVIIINKEGIKIEPIMGSMATAIERVGEAVPKSLERFMEKWWEKKEGGKS